MSAAFIFLLIAFAATLATLAIRDHRRAVTRRLALFDDCRGVLDSETWSAGDDGVPQLDGLRGGLPVKAALIPDTMVVRRLPQLWLAVTLKAVQPKLPALSILARPSGNEFYAPIMDLPLRIEPPAGLPHDILIRGDSVASGALCHFLAADLARLLSDPRCKEITLTARGLRITRQASEGRRGEHLLLRQAVFDDAAVPRADLECVLADLDDLLAKAALFPQARAA